jgi:hypothetical protein
MQLALFDGDRQLAQQRADGVTGSATLGELLARLDPAAAGSGADCEVGRCCGPRVAGAGSFAGGASAAIESVRFLNALEQNFACNAAPIQHPNANSER